MTENKIYPISADFYDSSSNSTNLLKLDIYPSDFIPNSNSNSNLGINITSNSNSSSVIGKLTSALSPIQNFTTSSNQSMDSLRENPVLGSTASITIPPRSNTNTMLSSSFGGVTVGSGTFHSIYSASLQQNSQQQPKVMADFSEFGIDVLDASSLSPTLLQDNSSSNSTITSTTNSHLVGSLTSGLTLINNLQQQQQQHQQQQQNNSPNNNTSNATTTITTNQIAITTATTPNIGDYIVYEVTGNSNNHNQQQTINNSNTMWSDIGNAMKTEPFQMDDDYIFQIEQGPTLAELNDETLLEDLNIEDFIHDPNYLLTSGHHHSNLHQMQTSTNLNSPGSNSSSSMPPQQLMQHQTQQQQQQQNLHQMQTQQQQLHLNINRNFEDNRRQPTSSPYEIYHSTPNKNYQQNAAFSPSSQTSSSPLMMNSITPPPPHANRSQFTQMKSRTPLHELLKKEYSHSPDHYILGQSVPGPSTSSILMSGTALSPVSSGFGSTGRKQYSNMSGASVADNSASISRLSSSAPTHLGHEQIWRRREPRQHLLSTGSLAEAESFSSISTGSVLSPEGNDFSHDEGYSDYDSDHYEDFSSDNGSDIDDDGSQRLSMSLSHNHSNHKSSKERFFWQYNVQAKGPKGQRLVIKTQLEDPHVLNEVTDPVFSPNCSVRGIKHSGKARKGDGNDLTPNPRKLHAIGKELDKLGRTINEMTPVSELPFNIRPKSRKEKNKLASRACRLKKKAQHEANKIKLYGLEIEHRKMLNGINDLKRILAIKYQNQNPNLNNDPNNNEELNQQLEHIVQQSTTVQIAGSSTDFVNKILEKVKAGQASGGLEELKKM